MAAQNLYGSTIFLPKNTKSIFGAGTTIEELTEDIIIELVNVKAAATGNVAGVSNINIFTAPGVLVLDGVALNLLDRVLLQQQTNPIENGIYQVLQISGPTILARVVDFKPNIHSSKVLVSEGATLACSLWFNDKDPFLVIGFSDIKFVRDDGSGAGGGGNVIGIPPSVPGNIALFNNFTSTEIIDSGVNIADLLAALNQIIDVVLTGTLFTSILSVDCGSFLVSVKNLVSNGPSAVFSITKNDDLAFPSIQTLSITPGTGTGELLELRWDPTMDLELRKTGPNYDGVYRVVLFGNGAIGGGTVTDATNVGGFAEVFKQKVGTILEFRTLEAGTGISITQNPDTLLITNTGGGGAAGRIAFNIAAIEIIVNVGAPAFTPLAYFSWDNSEYSSYTDGRVTFNAEIGDQEVTMRLFDVTGAVVLGSLTTTGSGAYTFPVASPVADSRLILQMQHDNTGVVEPMVFGTTLSFQQPGGGGSGQIAFVIAAIEIIVQDPVFTALSYFAWDQSEYGALTNGTITFEAQITGKSMDLRLREIGGAVLTAIPTINVSGVYTFALTSIPAVDRRLVLEGFSSGVGAEPMLFGATLRFDQ